MANEDAFMQVLAIVRAEDSERTEAMRVYREFMQRVDAVRALVGGESPSGKGARGVDPRDGRESE